MNEHLERKYLPQFVYGGIDGAITTLAVIAGSIGAVLSPGIILVLGFANLIADGFSMGISNYLSAKSEKELKYKITRNNSLAIKKGLVTFISFLIIGFIPLFPFVLSLFVPFIFPYEIQLSIIFTGIALIIVGSIKGKIVNKSKIASSIETLIIGGIAASLAFLVGFLLKGLVT